MIRTKDVLKKLYKKLDIDKEIINLIYDSSNEDKFVLNEFTMKIKLSNGYLKNIS
jgi:hypothetical protein